MGLAYSWRANKQIMCYRTVFAFSFLFGIRGKFPNISLRGLIFGGAICWRVFYVTSLGGLYLERLIHRGAYFRNFTVSSLGFLDTHLESNCLS